MAAARFFDMREIVTVFTFGCCLNTVLGNAIAIDTVENILHTLTELEEKIDGIDENVEGNGIFLLTHFMLIHYFS